jgi:peroxiredoxin
MPLQAGAQAPDVTLVSHTNQPVSLGDYRGKQPVVVLFFPLAFTSTCTAELCAVRDDIGSYEELEAEVFAVSVDSPYVLKRFREETGAPYTFLSDFHREAAEAFDVLRSAPLGPGLRNTTDRSAFVIGRDGKIAYSWHSPNPSLIPPFDEIKDALRRL